VDQHGYVVYAYTKFVCQVCKLQLVASGYLCTDSLSVHNDTEINYLFVTITYIITPLLSVVFFSYCNTWLQTTCSLFILMLLFS